MLMTFSRRVVASTMFLAAAAALFSAHPAIPDDESAKVPPPPEPSFAPDRDTFWELETSLGSITVRLFTDVAPRHAANVVHLAGLGYYDGLYFHRVIPGFMAQGGGTSPAGRGGPGPSYSLEQERDPGLSHDRAGLVSMVAAGASSDRSHASQFFITLGPARWLDERNTVLGEVVAGMETLRAIERTGSEGGEPAEPIRILRTRISERAARKPPEDPALLQLRAYVRERREAGEVDPAREGWRRQLPPFPELAFTQGRSYLWHLETSLGPITIRFLPDLAPRHVASFLYLAEIGYFDGLTFHRVIPGFMAQGGRAPTVTYPNLRHERAGILSMANTGRANSEGSQFFITFRATRWLDGKHTIFGAVVNGMPTVREIERRGSRSGETSEPLVIERTWGTAE